MNGARVALVTGAAGGVGSAICRRFLAAGIKVLATDSSGDLPEGVALPVDLRELVENPDCLDAFVSEVARVADGQLDVLINNAATQCLGAIEELTAAEFIESQVVNVAAPYALTRAFAPMLEAARGSVVNITSIHASATKPGFAAYATSKAALEGLTRSLAVELGGRIRVNAISPAALSTPMLEAGFAEHPELRGQLDGVHPAGRIGGPDEVARLALAICEPELPFLTGSVIGLDGGIRGRLHDPV